MKHSIDISHKSELYIFDSKIMQTFANITAFIGTVATLYSLLVTIPDNYRLPLGLLFLLLLFVLYIVIWQRAKYQEAAHIHINGTNVNVIIGDIFKQNGWKVIGVNDFFDTIADDCIIAKRTLHGIFLDKYKEKIPEIDRKIDEDERLKKFICGNENDRLPGKSIRYELGTILTYEDYMLVAFGKVENEHQVFLDADSYIMFLMHFWKNVDVIYAGRDISIPLLGAGITRFHGEKPSKQQLLEIMLWTMKVSGFRCTYPENSVNFIIHENDKREIDFFRISKGILN